MLFWKRTYVLLKSIGRGINFVDVYANGVVEKMLSLFSKSSILSTDGFSIELILS